MSQRSSQRKFRILLSRVGGFVSSRRRWRISWPSYSVRTGLFTEYRMRRHKEKQNAQRASRRKQNRKALKLVVRIYFLQRDKEFLGKQAQGAPQKDLAGKGVKCQQPGLMRLAELFGDMEQDMPEDMIVQRRITTINTAVVYARMAELGAVLPPLSPSPGPASSRGFSPKPKPAEPKPSPESPQVAIPITPTHPPSQAKDHVALFSCRRSQNPTPRQTRRRQGRL